MLSKYNIHISNIKISVKTELCILRIRQFQNLINCKENGSFFVFRLEGFVFSVYYSGHFNVTGLRNTSEIKKVKSVILSQIIGVTKIHKITIDNITCTSKLNKTVYTWEESFVNYLQRLEVQNSFDIIQYSPQTFPGAFLKTLNTGTIIFFATGKFNIVGCSSEKEIKTLLLKFLRSVKNIKQ